MKFREIQKRYPVSSGYTVVMICNKHNQILRSVYNDNRLLEGIMDMEVLDWNGYPNRGSFSVKFDCEYIDLMGLIEKKRRKENGCEEM